MHSLAQRLPSRNCPPCPVWRLAYCDGCSGQPTSGPATRSPPSLAPARRTRSQTPALGPRETKRDWRNMHINATRCIYYSFSECVVSARNWLHRCFAASGSVPLMSHRITCMACIHHDIHGVGMHTLIMHAFAQRLLSRIARPPRLALSLL